MKWDSQSLSGLQKNIVKNEASSLIVRVWRILRLTFHVIYGVIVASTILNRVRPARHSKIVQLWTRKFLRILNIRVVSHGQPPDWESRNALIVANHISWVDIHALNSIRTLRFIGKSEIRNWPVIGWLAAQANTMFIERNKRQDAGRIVDTISARLNYGDCMCYFPEGTTTDGSELGIFKSSLMQAAIDAGASVWPVSIRYPNFDGSPNLLMAYAGNTSLLESFWMIISQRSPVVELEFHPPIESASFDRRGLTLLARSHIASGLNLNLQSQPASLHPQHGLAPEKSSDHQDA